MNPLKEIDKKWYFILSALLFLIMIAGYEYISYLRHLENSHDKLFPSISQIAMKFYDAAFVPNKRTGDLLLWKDTVESLKIYGISMGGAIIAGAVTGILMGLYSAFRGLLLYFIIFLSIVPPLAILPVLLVGFGAGIESKIALIFIGIFPVISLLIYQNVKMINKQEIIKAVTLGIGNFKIAYKLILPRSIPSILESIRVANGMAWLLLIASEAISAKVGLGYRIFLVRRYMAMDTIFAYVLWIIVIAFMIDYLLKLYIDKKYPWYYAK